VCITLFLCLLLTPLPTDPDKPAAELNPVEPLFPPDHVVGELHGVTENSKDIFINWASNNDKRAIVAVQTGSNEHSLSWS
jgi:hypothetical protein